MAFVSPPPGKWQASHCGACLSVRRMSLRYNQAFSLFAVALPANQSPILGSEEKERGNALIESAGHGGKSVGEISEFSDGALSTEVDFALPALLHLLQFGDYAIYGLDHGLDMSADVLRSLHL